MVVFFVRELAARLGELTISSGELGAGTAKGNGVIVNCLTPGACRSDLSSEATGVKKWLFKIVGPIIQRTTEVGSRTLVAGTAAGKESHGAYMEDCAVAR